MTTEILQVRDIPAGDVEVLRQRAASRKMSLSSYLRELIHHEVSLPTMGEAIDQIADRESVDASSEDIRSWVEHGRR